MPEHRVAPPRALHQNLDTAYVNLAALLRHLQQRDFEGRVHVEMDEYDADIYLAARSRPRVRERDHVTGRVADGDDALQRVLVRASEPGGLVSVFEGEAEPAGWEDWRGPMPPARAGVASAAAARDAGLTPEEIDRRNVLQLSGELIASVERAVSAASSQRGGAGESDARKGGDDARESGDVRENSDAREGGIARKDSDARAGLAARGEGGDARRDTGAGGDFAAHFREARAELAERFPFLSSLSSCVEYVGGEARLSRAVEIAEFVEGVCAALRAVVERAAREGDDARGVRREVARELAALEGRRPRALARFRFSQQLERIAGLRWT
jgi:hypothetical protein